MSKAKYLLSGTTAKVDPTGAVAVFTNYRDELFFESGKLLIQQDFDPIAVLTVQAAATKKGQWLYATSFADETRNDTVACYHLTRSVTGDTCTLELRERIDNHLRRWRSNNSTQLSWQIEVAKRQVTATQGALSRNEYQWRRTYKPNADFSETLGIAGMSSMGAGVVAKTLLYKREYRRINKGKAVDTYTVMDPLSHQVAFTFTILSLYQ
ncbi:hypothetical protein GCM10011383_43680 [Hymenobacter cavernae]|uniref:Uncharacterized protein n=1 Tax=Hymenobacter cavernae TaxID=2044852 RepID=A0ABQ1UVP5_9BACT|nr:hypothetical protein GCM10011383_43680 [Hymenobacter cavernae]